MSDKNHLNDDARERYGRFERNPIRLFYRRASSLLAIGPLGRQRVKLVYFMWGYWPIVFLRSLSIVDRIKLISRFLRIDWHVVHGHLASEIACIAVAIGERRAKKDEAMVEAGCWKGGSSAKFSILCDHFGYQLHIYDSFEGVERLSPEDQTKEWNFAGKYASPENVLKTNLQRYGCPDVCKIYKGWFSETLANQPVPFPVRLAYIDCDLGKGTFEALQGIVPSLSRDGSVFTQDFHIEPVRRVLQDPDTWKSLKTGIPKIQPKGVFLARLDWI